MDFRNLNGDFLFLLGAVELHPSFNLARGLSEMHRVVLDKGFRLFEQLYAASQPAVVPPVRMQAGDSSRAASVVHFHHHAVLTVRDLVSYFKVERRESAFVFAQLVPI